MGSGRACDLGAGRERERRRQQLDKLIVLLYTYSMKTKNNTPRKRIGTPIYLPTLTCEDRTALKHQALDKAMTLTTYVSEVLVAVARNKSFNAS